MMAKRRIWCVAGVTAVALAIALMVASTPSTKPAVVLTFAGYTNNSASVGGVEKGIRLGLITVSNSGARPVVLSAGYPRTARLGSSDLELSRNEFRVLQSMCSWQTNRAGESLTLAVLMGKDTPSWWTRIQYYELTPWMELSQHLMRVPLPLLQRLVLKTVPTPRMVSAVIGPITNTSSDVSLLSGVRN